MANYQSAGGSGSKMSRRHFLQAGAAISAYATLRTLWPTWLPRLAFAQNGISGDVIVCVFLRGGADALNMVVPFGDENYYAARPLLAFAPPDSRSGEKTLELDNFFGLNPDMRPLHELYRAGHITTIHATGAPHASRSHFEAMNMLEQGADGQTEMSSGWLGRYLMATSSAQDSPLRAIGWGDQVPTSLRGYVSATALQSIADFHLQGNSREVDRETAALQAMYQNAPEGVSQAATATLQALETVRRINIDEYRPANGAQYNDTELGRGLKQTAALIKADVGLEVACVDHGNFDTHVAQGRTDGLLSGLVTNLANNLRAFHDDMQDWMGRVTVVVMSEFGRRVQENGGGGTDHGHGGAIYVMSNHLVTPPVVAAWPGLNANFLDNGDLQITTDYRDVLTEILLRRTPLQDVSSVFPNHTYTPVGLFNSSR